MAQTTIKKLFSLASVSMLALSGIGATTVSADEILPDPYDGRQLWTVQELLAIDSAAKQELDNRCGDKTGMEWSECRWDLQDEQWQRDSIYGAYYSFSEPTFVLTAINPVDETVSFVYHDTDMMEREMFGIEKHYPVKEAYLVWLDQNYDHSDYYLSQFRSGINSAPGMHVIFNSNTMEEESGWWPADQEITIVAQDHDISQNTTETNSEIFFSVYSDAPSVSGGTDYIGECLNSPRYQEGMKCQLFYDKYGFHYYLPVAIEKGNSDDGLAQNTLGAGLGGLSANPDANSGSNSDSSSNSAPDLSAESSVATPNTGQPTASADTASEFPWWGIIPAVLGLTTAIWLFWPKKISKSPKLPKKS